MKLKLSLRRILYATILSMAAPISTLATATLSVGALAYTIATPQAEAAVATWDPAAATDLYIHNMNNWTGDSGSFTEFWAGTAANTMRFDKASTTAIKLVPQFSTLSFSGVTVDVGAIGYTVSNDAAPRDVNLRATSAADYTTLSSDYTDDVLAAGKINFIINENFSYGDTDIRWRTTYLHADMNAYIAVGKEFNFDTINISATEARNIDIHGGGKMNLAVNTISDNVSWTVRGSATNSTTLVVTSVTSLNSVKLGGYAILDLTSGAGLTGSLEVSGLGNQLLLGSATTLANDINLAANSSLTLSGASSITGKITLGGVGSSISAASGQTLSLAGEISFVSLIEAGIQGADFAFELGSGVSIAAGATINLTGITSGTYTLFTTTGGNIEDLYDWANTTIIGLGARVTSTWINNGNSIELVLEGAVADLIWAGGNGVWSTDEAAGTDWDSTVVNKNFFDGDNVTFSGNGGSSISSVIDIQTSVSPGKILVDGNQNWEFSGSGSIDGAGFLVKSGTGTLTINNKNNYSGGTTITGGILEVGIAGALGSGAVSVESNATLSLTVAGALDSVSQVNMQGGTLQLSGGATTIDGSKLTIVGDANFNINLVGGINASFTNAASITGNQNIVLTGNGSLTHSDWSGINSVNVAANTNLIITGGNGGKAARVLSGSGTITFNINPAVSAYSSHVNIGGNVFNGTIDHSDQNGLLITFAGQTADSRFSLIANDKTYGTILANSGTLYLNSLTGDGRVRADWGQYSTARTIDLLLSGDNTFSGEFHNSSGNRMHKIIIDSASGTKRTFVLDGKGFTANTSTAGTLEVKNADVIISKTAQWNGKISLSENANLNFLNSSYTRSAAAGVISGAGSVTVSGNSTVSIAGSNTYTGGTTVTGGANLDVVSKLIVAGNAALGTGAVSATGGNAQVEIATGVIITNDVSLANGAKLDTGNITITNNVGGVATLTNHAGNKQLGGSTLNNATLSKANITLKAGTAYSFDKLKLTDGTTFSAAAAAAGSTGVNLTLNDVTMAASGSTLSGPVRTGEFTLDGVADATVGPIDIYTIDMIGEGIDLTLSGTLTLDVALSSQEAFDTFIANYEAIINGTSELHYIGFVVDGVTDITGLGDIYVNVTFDGSESIHLGLNAVKQADGSYIFVIPEPSTATLSLLALAGLAARRRRRKQA